MISKKWSDLIEDIEDISKTFIGLRLYTDIIKSEFGYKFKDYSYDIIFGYDNNSEIKVILDDFDRTDLLVNVEGEYECILILKKWIEDYSYGIYYYDIEEIEFKLIRTLKQRERDYKFDLIFDDIDFNI